VTTAASRGAASKSRGDQWEEALVAYHDLLARAGKAHIQRVPTPVTVLGAVKPDARGRRSFPACFAARAGVDFVGVLAGGRACYLEAKTCSTERWPFAAALGAPTQSRVEGPEWESLARCQRLGGLALVVLDWSSAGAGFWAIDFSALETLRAHDAASVGQTTLAGLPSTMARPIQGAQWLSA
jgi:hypothetical protein